MLEDGDIVFSLHMFQRIREEITLDVVNQTNYRVRIYDSPPGTNLPR